MKTAFKVAIFLALLVIALLVYIKWFRPGPQISAPPVSQSGEVKPEVTASVTRGDPILPKPDEHITGVLRITIPADTTKPPAKQKPTDIYIYIPDKPKDPPEVRSTVPLTAEFSPVVDPWFLIEPRLVVGGSASFDGFVSPFGGVSFVRLFNTVDLGTGIDRSAIGLFAGYGFFREFQIGAMWYAVPLRENAPRAGIVIAYRF